MQDRQIILLEILAMAGTFSQLYVHLVFAVEKRESLINEDWKEDLYKYIGGIIKLKKQKPLIINGMPDHIHLLISMSPAYPVSMLVREIKSNSSAFINAQKLSTSRFKWQEGYGAFSCSQSHVKNLYAYIFNQQEHHKKASFKSEYLALLDKFQVDYDEKFLFEW